MREIDNDLLHESLFKNQPLLKFDEKADFQAWRKAVKEKFLELLGMEEIAKNTCDIHIEIEEEVRKDGYVRYRYVFESEKGCLLPCYLLIPDTGKEKYPVLVCIQGHSGGFHISIGEKKYPTDDLHLPSITFALDAVKNL